MQHEKKPQQPKKLNKKTPKPKPPPNPPQNEINQCKYFSIILINDTERDVAP